MHRPENEKEILAFARSRGLKNAEIVQVCSAYGWELKGEGRDKNGWPLCWAVAEECGISWGCGNGEMHQIKPENFKLPRIRPVPCYMI